jgi:hypothetical protein
VSTPTIQRRTVHYEQTITVIECCVCSIDFGLGKVFIAHRREDHGTFYCPNGHGQSYTGDNAEEQLRKEVERLARQRDLAREDRDRQRDRRLTAERQRAAAKGQVTKIKNRVARGVCPCCSRTFENVASHMAGQHPDYAPTQEHTP